MWLLLTSAFRMVSYKFLGSSVLILTLFAPASVWLKCEREKTKEIKSYDIDLDKPAYERFAQPTKDFKDGLIELIESEK